MTSARDRNFRPLPFLSNPHVQTILGHVLAWPRDRLPTWQHTVRLPDGDALVLHETASAAARAESPIVLLVHGLGGCHQSNYMRRVLARLTAAGLRVARLDLRGAGAGVALARRRYNAACSHDVLAAVADLHARYPHAPVAVAGFSLGGNIVLKMAGELGPTPPPNLHAVAAVNPPIDLLRCSAMISRLPFYDAFYVRLLRQQSLDHARHFPDVPMPTFPQRMTLWQFDEAYTAPRGGYDSVEHYYRAAAALPHIPNIALPTFVLTAQDDPFVAAQPIADITNPAVSVHVTPQGGHLGFLGSDGRGGWRWMEARLADWLVRAVKPSGR
jgi:predicted alpha/beta-fold hydrolase